MADTLADTNPPREDETPTTIVGSKATFSQPVCVYMSK